MCVEANADERFSLSAGRHTLSIFITQTSRNASSTKTWQLGAFFISTVHFLSVCSRNHQPTCFLPEAEDSEREEERRRRGTQHVTSETPVNHHPTRKHEMEAEIRIMCRLCFIVPHFSVQTSDGPFSAPVSSANNPRHSPTSKTQSCFSFAFSGASPETWQHKKPPKPPVSSPLGVHQPENRVKERRRNKGTLRSLSLERETEMSPHPRAITQQ